MAKSVADVAELELPELAIQFTPSEVEHPQRREELNGETLSDPLGDLWHHSTSELAEPQRREVADLLHRYEGVLPLGRSLPCSASVVGS